MCTAYGVSFGFAAPKERVHVLYFIYCYVSGLSDVYAMLEGLLELRVRPREFAYSLVLLTSGVALCVYYRTAVFAVMVCGKRRVTVHPTTMSLSSCTSVHTCFTWTAWLPCTTAAPGSVTFSHTLSS